jgi:hypothetical protein
MSDFVDKARAWDAITEKNREIERLRERCEAYKGQVKAGSVEIERLRTRDFELRSGLHVARGALLGIGTEYSREIAAHLAEVLDPAVALPSGKRDA